MTEDIEDVCNILLEISRCYGVIELKILGKTKSIVKAKLYFSEDIYVQIYVNVRKLKRSYTLILNEKRIFGKDYIWGKWHLHPLEDPDYHDESEKGKESTTLKEFTEEAFFIISEKLKII